MKKELSQQHLLSEADDGCEPAAVVAEGGGEEADIGAARQGTGENPCAAYAEGGAGEDATVALMAILTAAAPKMRTLVQGGEGMISDNEIRDRIASQQAIDKTAIQDAGKQVDAQVIDAQIVNAINGDK